jgi:hypothetical protein
MSENAGYQRSGVGCLTLLGLLFVGLKLAEIGTVATWSWWWVLAPFWIQFVIIAVILVVVLGGAGIAIWLDKR